MPFFYCAELTSHSHTVTLSAEESHHLRRVFRKQKGEAVRITNGQGLLASAVIDKTDANNIVCAIRHIEQISPQPERKITIALSTIRPNRMDWAVEKLTELGIGAIQPLHCSYTAIKTFKDKHLQKIAVSAIKQSEQTYLPRLHPPLTLLEWLNHPALNTIPNRFVAHPDEETLPLSHHNISGSSGEIVVVVGPEGGFHETEVELMMTMNFSKVKLANQVLRTETAAIAAALHLTCLIHHNVIPLG